jgi:uncharacterized membrane protein
VNKGFFPATGRSLFFAIPYQRRCGNGQPCPHEDPFLISAITWVLQALKNFRYSIAFLPSLLGLIYLLLGLAIVVPQVDAGVLPDFLDWLKFKEQNTASALLSTLIAGMISLMVFSFSMVMTVLSQAGNNFSHKLVFGLVSERPYQRVLGHYLGAILFILLLLIVPLKGELPSLWRSLGIYLGMIMVIHCLDLFVFFIHRVSQSVQVNAITAGTYAETRGALERLESRADARRWRHLSTPAVLDERCHTVLSNYSGYIQRLDLEAAAKLAERIDGVVHLNFSFGDYTVKNFPLFKVDSPEPPSEKWRAALLGGLTYVQGESPSEVYRDGLTQLMEIAIKALKTLSLYGGQEERDALQAHVRRVIGALETLALDSLNRQFINERLNNGEHCLDLPPLLPSSS